MQEKLVVDVAILFSHPNDLGVDLERHGIRVLRLNAPHKWAFYSILSSIVKLQRERQYDIFWGHLYFGNLYASLSAIFFSSIKTAVTFHSEGYAGIESMLLKEKLLTLIERSAIRRSDAKVAVSLAVSKDYSTFFNWSDIQIIYNGVATQDLPSAVTSDQKARIRKSYHFDASEFLLVTPARFVEKKGHRVLLEALSLMKSNRKWCPKLVACGQGPLHDELISLTKELGVEEDVRIVSPILHKELMELILSADAVVLPSLREPFGIAAAEAMALGKPVLLSRIDGFLELVGDSDSAMLFTVGDSKNLEKSLWDLHSNRQLQIDLGSRAKKRIRENFDISVCASKWTDLFEQLLEVKS